MPFVTKLEIAYGHHVSELRREKKERKEELYSITKSWKFLDPLDTIKRLASP